MENRYEIRGDKIAIFLNRKDGSELETIIDVEDFEKVNSHNGAWFSQISKGMETLYVVSNIKDGDNRRGIRLHRLIMDTPAGLVVDHINHDTLDNTRNNLRNVTVSENLQNQNIQRMSKSGYRGVIWFKPTGKWMVRVTVSKKSKFIGYFTDVDEAGRVAHESRIKLMTCYGG